MTLETIEVTSRRETLLMQAIRKAMMSTFKGKVTPPNREEVPVDLNSKIRRKRLGRPDSVKITKRGRTTNTRTDSSNPITATSSSKNTTNSQPTTKISVALGTTMTKGLRKMKTINNSIQATNASNSNTKGSNIKTITNTITERWSSTLKCSSPKTSTQIRECHSNKTPLSSFPSSCPIPLCNSKNSKCKCSSNLSFQMPLCSNRTHSSLTLSSNRCFNLKCTRRTTSSNNTKVTTSRCMVNNNTSMTNSSTTQQPSKRISSTIEA